MNPISAPAHVSPDLRGLCQAIAEHAPLPMAAVEGPGHIVRYVNAAFCHLMGKPIEQLTGKPLAEIVPADDECLLVLERVVRTGKSESHTGSAPPKTHAVFWSYTMWPVLHTGRPLATMLQVTETAQSRAQAVEMNEQLTLGIVRQHELTEEAESLNARLLKEMAERSRAEQALRQNAWRLRYATESARLTFVEIDLASGVARTPENFADVMGYVPPAEQHASVGARVLLEHVVAGDRQRVSAALQGFLGGESVGKLEYRVLGDDQIERWIETRWSTECDADGKPLRSFATNLDITERKQAEQAMRESEERYRNLFNLMDEGFCIIEMIFDEHDNPVDYLFLEVNPSFEMQSGIHEATGKRMREIAPDHEAYWFDIYGKVVQTGEAVRVVNEAKGLDGRWFDLYAFPVDGPGSNKVAVLFSNITERKKSEEALRQSEERFRVLFDRGPIAIYSCGASGKIEEFNAHAVALWGREPNRGDSYERFSASFQVLRPDGTVLPTEQTFMAKVLSGSIAAVYDQEVIIERPDGSRINVIANVVPLKNERQEIAGGMSCFYDITERSRLERKTFEQAQALADLDRRKDEFLAMLSHELRNPLAAMSNAANLLRLQKDEAPIQHKARAIIERQVGQLTRLVDDLLEVSRISTGRVQLRREPIAVSGIVERAVETAQPLIAEHRHQLTVAMPPESVWLHADAARLEQVLVNLLTNAAKYTEDGGRIWLSVEQEVDILVPMAVIKVRDSGIGIEPNLLPHIFDLFTQADQSLHRSEGGLGIGLSLVQRLVELHGGAVTASSVPGQGSEFAVRLPLLVRPVADLPVLASAALSASLGSSAPPAASGCRVLLVDDKVDSAQTLALLLEMSGHSVQLAYDGLSAVEAAMVYRPEVVLLDIGLPGLDGYQVAQRIRQQAELEGVTLVALTGYGRDDDRERSKQAGFDHHLVKPASFEQIEAILCGRAAAR